MFRPSTRCRRRSSGHGKKRFNRPASAPRQSGSIPLTSAGSPDHSPAKHPSGFAPFAARSGKIHGRRASRTSRSASARKCTPRPFMSWVIHQLCAARTASSRDIVDQSRVAGRVGGKLPFNRVSIKNLVRLKETGACSSAILMKRWPLADAACGAKSVEVRWRAPD